MESDGYWRMTGDHHRLKKVLDPIIATGSNMVLFLEQMNNILGACSVNTDFSICFLFFHWLTCCIVGWAKLQSVYCKIKMVTTRIKPPKWAEVMSRSTCHLLMVFLTLLLPVTHGRFPWSRNGNLLQYSHLKIPHIEEPVATVHRVYKELGTIEWRAHGDQIHQLCNRESMKNVSRVSNEFLIIRINVLLYCSQFSEWHWKINMGRRKFPSKFVAF